MNRPGILGGESVLFSAGWITQQSRNLKLFSANPLTLGACLNAEVIAVDPARHDILCKVALAADVAEFATYGYTAMPPAFALASLWLIEGGYRPAIDDLYIEERDLADIRKAFSLLGLPVPDWA